MVPTPPFETRILSEAQLEKLRRRVCTVADQLSDEQILMLADSLHETLRTRRRLRARVHQRLEERLGGVHRL
jgi:hypothetical protein